jgi:hypothetical protein
MRKELLYVIGPRGCDNVVIAGFHTAQKVPDTAADEEGLITGHLQPQNNVRGRRA